MDHQHQDEEDFSRLTLLLSTESTSQIQSASIQPAVLGPRPISKRRGKKRSSRACMTCRSRKVRCNIVAHGAPCSNCLHDEIECILPLSRRQKSAREREIALRKAAGEVFAEEPPRSSVAAAQESSEQGLAVSRATSRTRTTNQDASRFISAPHGMRISEHPLSEVIPTCSPYPPSPPSFPAPRSGRGKPWNQILPPLASAPRSDDPETLLPRLPKIFTPLPAHLDPSDLSYLQLRGALTLPSEEMQTQLLRAYVEFVHGTMPLLDLDEFMTAIKEGCELSKSSEPREKISFLLFQAVMFAAVAYVSIRILKEEGFQSRESAQRILFNRVRLLYDFDTCTDRVPIIQSLLLMTRCPAPVPTSTVQDNKDAYHWLGLAISLCYSLSLHRRLDAPHSAPGIQKLHKRIWWTCFIRDRTLSFSEGKPRPVRIRKEDCDVELLSLDDFELYDGLEEGEGIEERRIRANATSVVEKALLCWWCSDAQASSMSATSSVPQDSQPMPQSALSQPSDYTQQHLTDDDIYYHSPEDYSQESTMSPSEDCITPRYEMEMEVEEVKLTYSEKDLEQGYGVDDEYDDYLEYLKVKEDDRDENVVAGSNSVCGKSTWAIKLDCQDQGIVEV
ncbi:hypothetical protein BP5796_11489 [Coleophoma crateriformis]|uniref:Zn(2)-C6 fungal-type domain-containing protein n=1 Tax=Coleophoma crateriformis TaxID=565419 RepID=A0A3D8QIM6_9HELO|nr:hypothetical protein BP5796_11489 [Coleophoma crateriformis]